MDDEKEIRWVVSSFDDLLASVAGTSGGGLPTGQSAAGLEPTDWKPFDDVGTGTKKIRIKDANGIYRVMYIAKFEEAIYVLHCFQKKAQATNKQDKVIAETRYRAVVNARKEKK